MKERVREGRNGREEEGERDERHALGSLKSGCKCLCSCLGIRTRLKTVCLCVCLYASVFCSFINVSVRICL